MDRSKQHISDLAKLCHNAGISNVIISPGSRNAPLIRAFYKEFGDACISIVDERSAAYVGLGITRYTGRRVVLICTSGTAALNYGPALAEAYYQGKGLVAITADRPPKSTDKLENQVIHQPEVFRNYIRFSCDLPCESDQDTVLEQAHQLTLEALEKAKSGPVHINVPLDLPLYGTLPEASLRLPATPKQNEQGSLVIEKHINKAWTNAKRILLVHGQAEADGELSSAIQLLCKDSRVFVLAENISNLSGEHVIPAPELLFSIGRNALPEPPDLVLHLGRHLVSKRVDSYIRQGDAPVWRIDAENGETDTFGRLQNGFTVKPADFLARLSEISPRTGAPAYSKEWHTVVKRSQSEARKRMLTMPFSDLKAIAIVNEMLRPGAIAEIGNSSIIRISQLLPKRPDLRYACNRGVSGIDGCLSTAIGTAMAADTRVYSLIGDLGFLYDSNALWNRDFPDNLRIVVFNNKGGGIFRQIKGAADQDGYEKFIEAHHPAEISGLAGTFGLEYFQATNLAELEAVWNKFDAEQGKPGILEIETDSLINQEALNMFAKPLPLQ